MKTQPLSHSHVVACFTYALRAARQASPTWESAGENCVPLLEAAARRDGNPRLSAALAILRAALAANEAGRRAEVVSALDTCLRELLEDGR